MDLLQFTGKIPLWVLFCVSIQLDKTTIMKNLFLVCLAGILTHTLSAQFEGPLSGGSFTNTAIVGSNKSWTNTSNAGASDNTYASFGNLGGDFTIMNTNNGRMPDISCSSFHLDTVIGDTANRSIIGISIFRSITIIPARN